MKADLAHPGRELARFAAQLQFAQIPGVVLRRAEDLLLDWIGSTLAGKSARPVEAINDFTKQMGPTQGKSEILIDRRTTSPWFAAMVNAAASHMVEQDDLHNSSVLHPATVVFPPALAIAQDQGNDGKSLLTAVVAGYEVGIRVGEYLGRSHYEIFHTTGTVGTLAAAATAGNLLKLNPDEMLHAFGSAGTQAAGLWEFLRDAADSKQLHPAKAAVNGMMAAYLAANGFTGAQHIFDGKQGMAAGMSQYARPEALTDRLGERWALIETSFKYHASCRHTHPAADALLALIKEHDFNANDIEVMTARVHQAAIDVLGAVDIPQTVHQAKFSMGTVLALTVLNGRAGVNEFEQCLDDSEVAAIRERVRMVIDDEVDSAYPQQWLGRVDVSLKDGRTLAGRIDYPRGDPQNTLTREELEQKAMELAQFRRAASKDEMLRLIQWVWNIENAKCIGRLFWDS